MIGAAGRSTLCAATLARSRTRPSSTSVVDVEDVAQLVDPVVQVHGLRSRVRGGPQPSTRDGCDVRSVPAGRAGRPRCRRRGASRPAAATSARSSPASSRCSAMPCCALASGRTASSRRRSQHAGELAAAVRRRSRTAPSRPAAASRQPADGVGVDVRHVDGQHDDQRAGCRASASRPASRPATGSADRRALAGEGHRPRRRHRVADHDHLGGVDDGVEGVLQQGAAARARARPCRRRRAAPPCRRRGRPRRTRRRRGRSTRQSRTAATVAGWAGDARCASPWCRRRPTSTPPTTAAGSAALVPDGRRPGGAPRGVRARLRRGRLRRQRRTPSRWTGRSRPRWRGWPPRAAPRWWPGCSRPAEDPTGRTTRWWCAAAPSAAYRKIHLYDSFGYRESDRLARRPARAGAWSTSAASPSA